MYLYRLNARQAHPPVNVLHDIPWPSQLDLQLPSVLHKEVNQCSRDRRRRVEEKSGDPKNGPIELFQTQKEVVAILNGQEVVVILLQDAGVKGGKVGFPSNIFLESLSWSKIAPKDKIRFIDFLPALAPSQDPAVANHCTDVVMLVQDGRHVRKQRLEVIADGENVLMAGVVVVHQLPNPNAALDQGKVFDHVDMLKDFLPKTRAKQQKTWSCISPFFAVDLFST